MKLPKKVSRGEAVKAEDFNSLLDFVKSLELKSGPGYLPRRSPGGTSLNLLRKGGGGGDAGAPPSFRMRSIRRGSGDDSEVFYVKIEAGYVTNGNPRDPGPIRTYNMVYVEGVGEEGSNVALDADEAPEIAMAAGDFLYLKTELDDTGQVMEDVDVFAIVSADGDLEGTHYIPDSPEMGGATDGEHYRKILELEAIAVDAGEPPKVNAVQWYEGDVELSPYVWQAAHPNEEGFGPYHQYEEADGVHEFRSHKEIYGHLVEWDGAYQIEHNFDAENMDPGSLNGASSAEVYREKSETVNEGATTKAEFRKITQGVDDARQEIQVDQVGDRVEIKGNDFDDALSINDDGTALNLLVPADGLVSSVTNRISTIQLDVCQPGAAASDPPTKVSKKFLILT
tara:strand:- start:5450 stop:6637 length:1188 start_codon:yes stop_codon:yes gene_type:complete